MPAYPDDRRYLTYEERAKDDPRYRGEIPERPRRAEICRCGKTVYRDGFGVQTGNVCPRGCEA